MGGCFTKCGPETKENQQIKKRVSEIAMSSYGKGMMIPKLVKCREKLITLSDILNELHETLDEHAKIYIKKHKTRRSLFTLKKIKLYTQLSSEVQKKFDLIDRAMMKPGTSDDEELRTILDETSTFIAELEEMVKLEEPLEEDESARRREKKFRYMFQKYGIENADVFEEFAVYEAETNEFTLTSSITITRSQPSTQPNSDNDLEQSSVKRESQFTSLDQMIARKESEPLMT